MCVIIVKRRGAPLPSRRELEAAARCNPDGYGFISSSGISYRGLDFRIFVSLLETVPEEDGCIIHLRLATHGPVNARNCHPFEKGGVWFAHNGVLPVIPEKGMTDSETAFRRILYPVIEEHGLDSPELATAVDGIIGSSRFAFMKDGRIRLFGPFTEYGGRLYSNTRHLWPFW